MKQTNNAIKFLMAQYRAIFKNANIAMVAAMVAAALAAGQANAAAQGGQTGGQSGGQSGSQPTTQKLEQAGWAGLAGDKTVGSGGDFSIVELTAKGDEVEVNNNAFTLTIKSGSGSFIDGTSGSKGGFSAQIGRASCRERVFRAV